MNSTRILRARSFGGRGARCTAAYGAGGVTADLPIGANGSASQSFTLYARVLSNQQGAASLTYSWSSTSPAIEYGYQGKPCPTGNNTASAASTLWTATVAPNCTVSATGVNFGSSGSITSNIDAAGTVTVQCTNATPYTVGLNGGNSGASRSDQSQDVQGV